MLTDAAARGTDRLGFLAALIINWPNWPTSLLQAEASVAAKGMSPKYSWMHTCAEHRCVSMERTETQMMLMDLTSFLRWEIPLPLPGQDIDDLTLSTGFAALHPWLHSAAPLGPKRLKRMRRCRSGAGVDQPGGPTRDRPPRRATYRKRVLVTLRDVTFAIV